MKTTVNGVFEHIEAFLDRFESEKTKKEYRRDMTEYFNFMREKKLDELVKEDIEQNKTNEKLTQIDAAKYRKHLIAVAKSKESKNYTGTINRKITTMRSFYKFLQGLNVDYDVNYLVFALKNLVYEPNSYDTLSKDEAVQMAEYLLENNTHGKELLAYIVIASATSIRVGDRNQGLLSLQWKKVKKADERFHTVSVKTKGNKTATRPIDSFMYEMIREIKSDSEYVFPNLTTDNVHHAITNAAKVLGFQGRITTHSLRSIAPTFEMKYRKNIELGMAQTGHSSVEVYMSKYVKNKFDFADMSGIRMWQTPDDSVFNDVSKEELLRILRDINATAYEQLLHAVIDRNKS